MATTYSCYYGCYGIITVAKMNKTEDDNPDLAAQREMSIFSNVVDLTVIYDRRS